MMLYSYRTEQERQKRLSLAQSNNDVDCKLKESMRRENHSTREEAEKKPYRSCHKNQTCDDHINSCDYQASTLAFYPCEPKSDEASFTSPFVTNNLETYLCIRIIHQKCIHIKMFKEHN